MKHEQKILVIASLGLMSVTAGTALAADAAPTGPTLGSVLEASGITATGYVAASYYQQTADTGVHNYDFHHETFQLDQVGLTLAYQPKEGFGALVNVLGGEDARTQNAGSGDPLTAVNLSQAFVQYVGGPFTVMAGKYYTLAGAEVVAPSGNTNFSRSILFFFEPSTHTGIRGTIAANDMFSFTAGVNNGWNYNTNSASKTAELGFSFTPIKAFSLLASYYTGESGQDAAVGKKSIFDLVATYNATDALTFIVNYDAGEIKFDDGSPKQKADGVAAYANFAFTDEWRVSLRGEYVTLKETGSNDEKLKEVTATLGYAPIKSVELRAEVRQDMSNKDKDFNPPLKGYFEKFSTKTPGTPTDNNTEFAFQGLYKF